MRLFSGTFSSLHLSACCAVALVACSAPESLPEDLDALVHFGWQNLDEGSSEDLAMAIALMDRAVGAADLEGKYERSLTELSLEEASQVGVNRDPAAAVGLFLARDFVCDMPTLTDIFVTIEQGDLYPEGYDTYDRAYSTDLEAWLSGEEDQLAWDVQYTNSLLGSDYLADVDGLIRRVGGMDPAISVVDSALVSRLTLMEPATFESSDSKSMELNFQLEFFYEREPGRIMHLYASWGHADMGAGITTNDSVVQSLVLDGMSDWDDQTERLCAERMGSQD